VVAGGLLSLTDGKEVSSLRWQKFVQKFPFLAEFEEGRVRVQRIDSDLQGDCRWPFLFRLPPTKVLAEALRRGRMGLPLKRKEEI